MSDCMTFPEKITDFLESYSFIDTEQIYTNGSKLISIFRVIQALEHFAPELLKGEENESLYCRPM